MQNLILKNTHYEIQLFRNRIVILFSIISFFILFLIIRLFYLQVLQYSTYQFLSQQNQLSVMAIEPKRGLIYDRNGVLLAANQPIFNLEVKIQEVKNLKKNLQDIQKYIPFNSNDIKLFYKTLKERSHLQPIVLRSHLSEEEVALFAVNQHLFPGFTIQAELLRYYPLGKITAPILGYVSRISEKDFIQFNNSNYHVNSMVGKAGIERYYETQLRGTVGYTQIESEAHSKKIHAIKQIHAIPGENIYLSIDSRLQKIAVQALGDTRGAIVAIEPKTGQILALVSNPSYDPNLFVQGISSKSFKNLQKDPSQPLYNRAITGQYSPGSTIKPLIALAALSYNIVDPQALFLDKGWFQLPHTQHIYYGWNHQAQGWVNLTKAIAQSSDPYFYHLGVELGIRRISHILEQFGLGKPTRIEMFEESAGLVPTPEWKWKNQHAKWYIGNTLITAIGQGDLLVTPLQLALIAATLSQEGQGFKPTLFYKAENLHNTIRYATPQPLKPIKFSSQYWHIVINAMQEVIKNGTASRLFGTDAPYTIAAKTGTAQIFSIKKYHHNLNQTLPEKLRDNHLFIAFAPVKQSKIALAVLTEHRNEAAQIAREVLDYFFWIQNQVQ